MSDIPSSAVAPGLERRPSLGSSSGSTDSGPTPNSTNLSATSPGRAWSFDWDATPGEHRLSCRATDADGRTQPLEQSWNVGGYCNNMVQTVRLHGPIAGADETPGVRCTRRRCLRGPGAGRLRRGSADRSEPASDPVRECPSGRPGEHPQVRRRSSRSDPSGSATIIVAGDIARCSELKGAGATADLVAAMAGFVMTAGDNAYESGTADEFLDCYDQTWGRFVERTFPVPGNHDYYTSDASGYFGYFGERAGPAGRGYYAFSAGRMAYLRPLERALPCRHRLRSLVGAISLARGRPANRPCPMRRRGHAPPLGQ